MNQKSMLRHFGWPQRYALIRRYNPTPEQVCATFSITSVEYDAAMLMQQVGVATYASDIDVDAIGNVFEDDYVVNSVVQELLASASDDVPETASRPARTPQKRGRKGSKIHEALLAVPTTPMPIGEFIEQHGVSLAVLRQSKRFVASMSAEDQQRVGTVCVKMNRETKQLMNWKFEGQNT